MHGPILLEDANDIVDMAEALRRTFPRRKWVTEWAEEDAVARMDALF